MHLPRQIFLITLLVLAGSLLSLYVDARERQYCTPDGRCYETEVADNFYENLVAKHGKCKAGCLADQFACVLGERRTGMDRKSCDRQKDRCNSKCVDRKN